MMRFRSFLSFRSVRALRVLVWAATVVIAGAVSVVAQPPIEQMSGIPLPDPQLPDGTITVRVVRGSVTNNVTGQTVELRQGDTALTAVTDDEGRATFSTLSPGAQLQASTVLDSQFLQSQPFPAPGRGGVRIILAVAAADPGGGDTAAPAVSGTVTFGDDSWVQIELVEEAVEAYFFLDVVNPSAEAVEPNPPLVIDMPSGAQGTTVLGSSSPRALADGPRVELTGPIPPGSTPLHFAYILPYSGESLVIAQTLPADLAALLVSVEKWGDMDFVSSQVERRLEMPREGPDSTPYLMGGGAGIPAGRPLSIELVGMPHRGTMGSTVSVVLAVGILALGAWGGLGSAPREETTGLRRKLETKRERLFADLVKVERQYRAGKVGSTKHSSRRVELVLALEKVYREIDQQLTSVLLSSAVGAMGALPIERPESG